MDRWTEYRLQPIDKHGDIIDNFDILDTLKEAKTLAKRILEGDLVGHPTLPVDVDHWEIEVWKMAGEESEGILESDSIRTILIGES